MALGVGCEGPSEPEDPCPPGKRLEHMVGDMYIEEGICVSDGSLPASGYQGDDPLSLAAGAGDGSAGGEAPVAIPCDDAGCPDSQPLCNDLGFCVTCLDTSDCAVDGELCSEGVCLPVICTPGQKSCNGKSVQTCNEDGTRIDLWDCSPAACLAAQCVPCLPGQIGCHGNDVAECHPDTGLYEVVEACPEQRPCVDGHCIACYPGEGHCIETDAYQCAADGSGWTRSDS